MVDTHTFTCETAPTRLFCVSYFHSCLLLRSYKSNKLLCLRRRKIFSCCFAEAWDDRDVMDVWQEKYPTLNVCALWRENFEKKRFQRARFEEKLHETVSNDFKWSFSFCSVLFSFSAQYIFIVSREKWKKIYNYLVRLFCSIGEFEVFKCVKIVEGSSFMSQSIFRALRTWLTETLKILNFIRKSKYT